MTDLIATATETPIASRPASSPAKRAPKIAKVVLTDKKIKALQKTKAAPGKRLMIWDGYLDGFGVRVTDQGYCSFVYGARYPGSKHWTIREVGGCDAMTLEAARAKAKRWIELLQNNIDPRAEATRLEKEEARKRADTFSAAAEAYIDEKVIGPDPDHPLQRKGKVVARIIRKVFIATWKERPIADIDRADVLQIIKAKKRRHPAEARSWLSTIKTLFVWALDQEYGLDRSPCSDIKPTSTIGEKNPGTRALTDDEIAALWRAADRTPYPAGPIYKLLLLSGLRLNEAARANWSEFDLPKRQWIIPATRMKGKNTGPKKSVPHLVPLTAPMLQILESLDHFTHGDLLFSTTKGRRPVEMGSRVKHAIDIKMLAELRRIAEQRGDDPRKVELKKWVNHDLRRTVRTNLSALKDQAGRKISLEVKEAVMAHRKGAIVGTYDLHEFSDEKREALELWAARLAEIVNPAPAPDDGKVIHPRFRKIAS